MQTTSLQSADSKYLGPRAGGDGCCSGATTNETIRLVRQLIAQHSRPSGRKKAIKKSHSLAPGK
jgi:hypothetical protein